MTDTATTTFWRDRDAAIHRQISPAHLPEVWNGSEWVIVAEWTTYMSQIDREAAAARVGEENLETPGEYDEATEEDTDGPAAPAA